MKLGLAAVLVMGSLGFAHRSAAAQALPDGPAPSQMTAQATVPDSPRPQVLPNANQIAPGKGSSASTEPTAIANDADAPAATLSQPQKPATTGSEPADNVAPDIQPELGPGGRVATIRVQSNFVEVPFTVKDKNGQLVPGLSWRDVQVYDNNVRQHLRFWAVDPFPLSVAFVLDQTLPYQVMNQVNTSLGAVQGAFSPYDEMAVYTYANGTSQRTTFTAVQGARLGAVLEQSKVRGEEMRYVASDAMQQNVSINGGAQKNMTPLVNETHGQHLPGYTNNLEKENHPLYDAIFEAAKSLSRVDKGRRRVIYVVSDGKEHGSKVSRKQLVEFLATNRIAVYGTVVGDSAVPYVGFLDKYHIPFTMKENVLPQLAAATGGEVIHEFRVKGIETSFARIAADLRLQYTAGYYITENAAAGKYHTVDVRVLRPDLDVIAKRGYIPSPEAMRPTSGTTGGSQQ